MPEGVEVKLQIEKLKKLKNQSIQSIKILSGRYSRHSPPKNLKNIQKQLPLTIISINHKGKFIYITLSNNWHILITLGMTGKLTIHKTPLKHDHILISTNKYNLYLNDLRNFGTIQFTNHHETLLKKLNQLGYDPLQEKISLPQFLAHIGKFKPNTIISELLLNQKFISGIGNYLRSDILFCSKINPLTPIINLSPITLKNLLKCIINTTHNSYKKQKNKTHKFIIYKQNISPSGNPVKKIKDSHNRTIWFDPITQLL